MTPVLRASWASRVGTYRARVNKDCGTEVRQRLERIRDTWARDVRVDTRHYQETIENTEPVMTSPTTGHITPEFEDYFAYNEYGTSKMSARPSMRQAIAAEQQDFYKVIDSILRGAGVL